MVHRKVGKRDGEKGGYTFPETNAGLNWETRRVSFGIDLWDLLGIYGMKLTYAPKIDVWKMLFLFWGILAYF